MRYYIETFREEVDEVPFYVVRVWDAKTGRIVWGGNCRDRSPIFPEEANELRRAAASQVEARSREDANHEEALYEAREQH